MHGKITTTYLGDEKTVCPDATATMTRNEHGTPTEEPSCFPTHGPPHDYWTRDELIRLCRANSSDFSAVCRKEPGASGRVPVGCPGTAFIRGGNWLYPLENNYYEAWFERDDDAPKGCDKLFPAAGSVDMARKGAQIDAHCVPAFEAIRHDCPWNGGEVRNRCGKFSYMSCPKGKKCAAGKPQG